MKLTNPESIKESEKEFIDTINAELDWEAIEKMLIEQHHFTLQDEVDYKNGDLIVHNDQIAYRFDFEIKVPLSLIFNRQGECLEMSTLGGDSDDEEDLLDADPDSESEVQDEPDQEKKEKVEQMASDIADMIHEINEGDE
ncbi:hypothetical protein [Desulfospira joergensenii]|uniref:hypothetical protein n=1 Tax=Desulfospira joergensenii TaxID=53329 RepID=UPI0003B40E6C|nr:hypothetical protein [Desulfospira joergensenii]